MRVRGTGPVPCEIMLIGPYPGAREDETGVPFSPGKWYQSGRKQHTAGDELDRYLNGTDLPDRDQVYLTNLHKWYRGKDYIYTQDDVDEALPELLDEIDKVQPVVVITMGREVTRLFLGDVDITDVEGMPWQLPDDSPLALSVSHDVTVFPLVHIAAGMRNPELSPYVVNGFRELGHYLNGDLEPRRLFDDPYPNPNYVEIATPEDLRRLTRDWPKGCPVAIDTEGWPAKPWSLQLSVQPGNAFLLRAGTDRLRQETLGAFFRFAHRRRIVPIFHSALHDLEVGRTLDPDGKGFDGLDFHDTMVMAYLLQLVPRGLKPGCVRYCGMRMREYLDMVGDIGNELARDYLMWLGDGEQADYEERCKAEFDRLTTTPYVDKKGKTHPGRRLKVWPKLPKTGLHKAVNRVGRSDRPRDLWLDQVIDTQVAAYNRLGPLPEPTLDFVDPGEALTYACRDADGTHRLYPEYRRRVDRLSLGEVYDLERSTYPLIDRMQRVGVKPDLYALNNLSGILSGEIGRLQEVLEQGTGRPGFNANSGDQVADFLFGTLGLEEVKFTSSGRGSTNDKILEALEHEHPEYPVISDVREYRETYKLKNTFVDRIPDYVGRWPFDGRVHATFRTTTVITGRLSAADPNMLAQPEHGLWAPYFKLGWVAEDGHYVCAWDESQIELRGLAHLSQDPVMLAVFRGEARNPDGSQIDLHAALAERIFGVKPKDQNKHKHRLPAKAINFGIPMGMTCKGLSVELRKNGVDADEDTAQRWLDETLGLYKGVAHYMESRKSEARRNGYVRCLSGRIRYIGGIRSRDDRAREEAERFAFSTPIQESAQFIMKQAEARVWNEVLPTFWKRGQWVEPILQVHDCLKLECEQGIEQQLNVAMRDAMTHVPKGFSVPLDVEGEYGENMAPTQVEDPDTHQPDPAWYNPTGMVAFREAA